MPPMAEAVAQSTYIVEILGVVAAGFGSIVVTGVVGFAKLGARFDAHSKHNAEAHVRMEDALEKLNDSGRKNTTAIAKINTRCDERHPR